MADSFHGMLQSRGALGSLGPPRIDSDADLGYAAQIANDMKREDLNRRMELMRFQQQMRIQDEQRAANNAALEQSRRTVFGPNKQRIVQQAPLTSMQQQFRQDELLADQRAQATKLAETNANARLQQALATGKLASDRAAAGNMSRESIAAENRAAQNERAEADRKSRETIAETGRNTVQVMIGPDGKPHAIATNPRDATAKNLTIDGQPIGDIYNPGTRPKPGKIQGMTPEQLADIRADVVATKKSLDLLLDPTTKELTSDAAYASGMSNLTRGLEYLPTPQQTGASKFDQLKSRLVLSLIQKMKAASKTGATGFGALNIKELNTLENAVTRAAAGKADKANKEALIEVGEMLDRMLEESDEEVEYKKSNSTVRPSGTSSNFVPDPQRGSAYLQTYSQSAGPSETGVYQPNTGRLPIGSQATGPAPVLRPGAAEALSILQRNKPQVVDTGVPVWQGSGNR